MVNISVERAKPELESEKHGSVIWKRAVLLGFDVRQVLLQQTNEKRKKSRQKIEEREKNPTESIRWIVEF